MGCDAGVGDNLAGVLLAVGDVGEEDARGVEPLVGILRLRYAGSVYLFEIDAGQSLEFFLSFERDLASRIICWAGVRGSLSLVGVSLDFVACHQPVTPSLADEAGEGGLGNVWDLPRGGGNELGDPEFIMAKTRSSIARRSPASWVSISSASRLLRSRSRCASASNSASDGRVRLPGAGLMNEPTRCAKVAANWVTDAVGDWLRAHVRSASLLSSSSSSSSPEWLSCEFLLGTKSLRRGECGLRGEGGCPKTGSGYSVSVS